MTSCLPGSCSAKRGMGQPRAGGHMDSKVQTLEMLVHTLSEQAQFQGELRSLSPTAWSSGCRAGSGQRGIEGHSYCLVPVTQIDRGADGSYKGAAPSPAPRQGRGVGGALRKLAVPGHRASMELVHGPWKRGTVPEISPRVGTGRCWVQKPRG